MLRFYYVIIVSLPLIIYYVIKGQYIMRHPGKFSEDYCYRVARNMVRMTLRNSHISVKAFGTENLPKEGGYIMFPNHQGKADALGIITSHDNPCSIVIDIKTAKVVLTNEFIGILNGIRLDRNDMRQQMKCIKQVADEVKQGRRFIIFPEGGYNHNQNNLQEFMPGAFKSAVWSKQPIVPVALVDSYIPYEINSLRRTTIQVHYLKPIPYEEYKDLSTQEISDMVKKLIQEKINSQATTA